MSGGISKALLLPLGLLLPALCLADRVQVPLTLDSQFLQMLLRQQVFTAPGGSLRVNEDGSGCQYLELRDPRVTVTRGQVLLRASTVARAGRAMGGRCLLVLDWQGELEFAQEPALAGDGRYVVLRTTDWRVIHDDGSTAAMPATVRRWLEQFLPAEVTQNRIDLTEPLDQLRSFLAQAMGVDAAGRTELLNSIAIDAVAAEPGQAVVTLGFEAPPADTPRATPAEPTLSAVELGELQQQLDAIDAFFTYTIKSLSGEATSDHRNALFEVLVELRRDLVAILAEPQRGPEDPARKLFTDAWENVAPVLRSLTTQQTEAANALHLLTFVGAGDALQALDRLGPAMGIEISRDGLRRLARILAPEHGGDPLERDDAVDAALRESLGFGPPLPPPWSDDDTTWVDDVLEWLVPGVVAAAGVDAAAVKRLNNWVPKTRDMDVYLPMVRDVLHHVVAAQLQAADLDSAHGDLFRALVFAAAWQESCWRQFEAKDDMRVPVQSRSGDLGMMQINATVWRGLYDLHGLRWDIVYNARAGADILTHYLQDYALRHGEHTTTGTLDSLARSAYAAYNGGPRQYDRYRRADAPAYGKKVDALFYEKYQAIKSGKELAVTACYG
jgi:hypothetical protein